ETQNPEGTVAERSAGRLFFPPRFAPILRATDPLREPKAGRGFGSTHRRQPGMLTRRPMLWERSACDIGPGSGLTPLVRPERSVSNEDAKRPHPQPQDERSG